MNNAQLARLLRCSERKLQLEALTLLGSTSLPLDVVQQLRHPATTTPTTKWDFREPDNGRKCLIVPNKQFELWDAAVFPDQPRVSCVWRFLRWLYYQKVSDPASLQIDSHGLFQQISKETDPTKFTREFLQVVREDVLASFTLLEEDNLKQLLARTALIRSGKLQHMDEKKELDWTAGPSVTAKSVWFVWMFTDWHKRRTGEDWVKHNYISWREIGTEAAHDRLLTTRTLDLKPRRPLVVHVGHGAWMVHDHLRGSFLCDNSVTAIAAWIKLNSLY